MVGRSLCDYGAWNVGNVEGGRGYKGFDPLKVTLYLKCHLIENKSSRGGVDRGLRRFIFRTKSLKFWI